MKFKKHAIDPAKFIDGDIYGESEEIMCGIAGVILRRNEDMGEVLYRMLQSLQHRGPDSTGVAVFGTKAKGDAVMLRLSAKTEEAKIFAVDALRPHLQGSGLPEWKIVGGSWTTEAEVCADGLKTALSSFQSHPELKVHSFGRSLYIYKCVGSAKLLNDSYSIASMRGRHGIGHVRLATESRVDVDYAHPFQSLNLADLAIAHNGQLTNYYKLRRWLEKRGYKFQTDNDSELIAQYIAYQIVAGATLAEALREALNDFDGTYSFIVATPDELGMAKDPLGAKPMMLCECDDGVAIASEEVAVRSAFGDGVRVRELPPKEMATWKV